MSGKSATYNILKIAFDVVQIFEYSSTQDKECLVNKKCIIFIIWCTNCTKLCSFVTFLQILLSFQSSIPKFSQNIYRGTGVLFLIPSHRNFLMYMYCRSRIFTYSSLALLTRKQQNLWRITTGAFKANHLLVHLTIDSLHATHKLLFTLKRRPHIFLGLPECIKS